MNKEVGTTPAVAGDSQDEDGEGEVQDTEPKGTQRPATREQRARKRQRRHTQVPQAHPPSSIERDSPDPDHHARDPPCTSTGQQRLKDEIQQLATPRPPCQGSSLHFNWATKEAHSTAPLLQALSKLKGPAIEEVQKVLLQMIPEAVAKAQHQAQNGYESGENMREGLMSNTGEGIE
ncbi:hypothetical protein RSAG8_08519, partial [Rhizoctonia solani AG-8 WAC10335]